LDISGKLLDAEVDMICLLDDTFCVTVWIDFMLDCSQRFYRSLRTSDSFRILLLFFRE